MAQNTFTPAGSETHLNARQIWNGNATDAEARFGSLELVTPQVVTSSSNILEWDHTLGSTVKVTLTEDVYNLLPNNAVEGDSGLIIVEQDGTSNWTLNDAINSRVLAGDLAVIGTDMTSATKVCTIGWYYGEGDIKYLYVSDVVDQTI